MKSFTLIEILISLSILTIIFLTFAPLGIKGYFRFVVESESQRIIEELRLSQFMAMTQKNDSSFGAYFLPKKIIFFQGDSFKARDQRYDFEMEIPSYLKVISSPQEIVFSKLEGKPKRPFSIFLEAGGQKVEIKGDSFGVIDFK